MKFLAVFFAVLAIACVSAFNPFLPDYCGKPCNEPSGMVCAYNQVCYNVFINTCAMRKLNCDRNERFLAVNMASCLMSGNKCKGM